MIDNLRQILNIDDSKVSLNQTYQQKRTFKEYPEVKQTFDELNKFTLDNKFYKKNEDGHMNQHEMNFELTYFTYLGTNR